MGGTTTNALNQWPLDRVLGLEFHLQALTALDADAIHVYSTALGHHDLSRGVRNTLETHREDHDEHVEETLDLLEDLELADVDPRNPSPVARGVAEHLDDADNEVQVLRVLIAYETFSRRMHRTLPLDDVPAEVTQVLAEHADEEARHREALEELLATRLG